MDLFSTMNENLMKAHTKELEELKRIARILADMRVDIQQLNHNLDKMEEERKDEQ